MTTTGHLTADEIAKEFQFLKSLAARGMRTDLSVMRRAAGLLDDPQDDVDVILVGGTNGKGSTAAYLGGVLTALGLGSCYVGCLPWEDRARGTYGLGADARLGAAVVYGHPATGRGNRIVDATVRRLVGATNKHSAAKFFYEGTWERPAAPPPELADMIEAARHAPSADNAQPWRFLWRDGALYLYVVRSSWRRCSPSCPMWCTPTTGRRRSYPCTST